MKGIKFRVRDTASNKIIGYEQYNTESKTWGFCPIYDNLPEGLELRYGPDTSSPILIPSSYTKVQREMFIEIYDNNGVEIYESDIVYSGPSKGVVTFIEDLVWDGVGSSHPGFYCKEWLRYASDMDYALGFDNCEVIGNIYEDPELLK